MKQLRIYVDTSVIGGCCDEEFSVESLALLDMAVRGEITLLVSTLLNDELNKAPEEVRGILAALPVECIEEVSVTAEAENLRDEYLRACVLGAAWSDDALHVAVATIAHADMVVSWNFKHLVHFQKIRGFAAVNLREGYPAIEIHSPKEVI